MAGGGPPGRIVGMILPVLTSTKVHGVVTSLTAAILGVTFIPLGFAFLSFGPLGPAFLGAGIACAGLAVAAYVLGRARDARLDAARTAQDSATVLDAELRGHSRVGAHHPLRLSVHLAGERRTRTLYVLPSYTYEPGSRIRVAFAPSNPANFLPLE
jgi:hypothetical protein